MHIKINGISQEFPGALNIQALAEQLNIDPKQVAIERNRAIVPRSTYADVLLSDGDEIEIVRFIGGG